MIKLWQINKWNMSNDNHLDIEIKKSGWVLKQSRYRKVWKKVWLSLESSELSYAETSSGPTKLIPLHGTVIEEARINNMRHVFRLTPLKHNRDFLLQAPNESEEQMWMQAICFAKVSAPQLNNSAACILQ